MGEVNQEERAYRAWKILTEVATKKITITYKELGAKLNVHHRTCRYFLDHIQNYCLDSKLPPLTILVVNQEGIVGVGFTAWDTNYQDGGLNQVYDENWMAHDNPFSYAKDGNTSEEIVNLILNKDDKLVEVYARIKVRGIVQTLFREALLKAYNNKCAFCGFPHAEALEASHIIPWNICSSAEKMSINNGILLCSNHHRLFDRGIISVSGDYLINTNTEAFKSNILGKRIRLPKDRALHPSKQSIERRNELLKSL
jgi:putative restriction endonuclease